MTETDWERELYSLVNQNQQKEEHNEDSTLNKEFRYKEVNIKLKYLQASDSESVKLFHSVRKKNCYFCNTIKKPPYKMLKFRNYLIAPCESSVISNHFMVFDVNHKTNVKTTRIFDILLLAEKFKQYLVVYDGFDIVDNGKSHCFFHLLGQNSLSIQNECANTELQYKLHESQAGYLSIVKNKLRGVLVIKSKCKQWVEEVYFEIEKLLGRSYTLGKRPFVNVYCWLIDDIYNVAIIPRVVKNPTQYYLNRDKRINISFGAIEMGGLISITDESDMDKISKEVLMDMYSQVSYTYNHLQKIMVGINSNL
ncbi:DUF4922 domain-containing protein [Labilibacter sediminis]|nr:DUF4922 domain-containing protein [Labilibacter sediminis]